MRGVTMPSQQPLCWTWTAGHALGGGRVPRPDSAANQQPAEFPARFLNCLHDLKSEFNRQWSEGHHLGVGGGFRSVTFSGI